MTLSAPQQVLLNRAAATSIEAEFVKLRTNWTQNRWLLPSNRYVKDCINQIKTDTSSNPKRLNHRHLREYIAASSVIHCMDGWSYLGRGIEAHLKGNSDIARHLGYYAELRAAMAFLASEGIGIFDRKHFVVDNKKKCNEFSGSTHITVWEALEHWTTTPSASNVILQVIQPGGLPLEEWLKSFAVAPSFHSVIAKDWLLQWGLDLKQLKEDREARNSSSYRPTAFSSSRAINVADSLQFVKDLWKMCGPTEFLRFPTLDRYLLRQSLETNFKSTHPYNRSSKQAKLVFHRQVRAMLHGLALRDLTLEEWEKFLNNPQLSDLSLLLEEAKGSDDSSSQRHHMQVLARATLLLRVATGAAREKLKTLPSVSSAELQFWWTALGEDRCLWDGGTPPDRFVDLWTDIEEALQALDGWQGASTTSGTSYNKLWREQASAIGQLGSCERVGLWGLGL